MVSEGTILKADQSVAKDLEEERRDGLQEDHKDEEALDQDDQSLDVLELLEEVSVQQESCQEILPKKLEASFQTDPSLLALFLEEALK